MDTFEFNIGAWANQVREQAERQERAERALRESARVQKIVDEAATSKRILEETFMEWGISLDVTGPTVDLGACVVRGRQDTGGPGVFEAQFGSFDYASNPARDYPCDEAGRVRFALDLLQFAQTKTPPDRDDPAYVQLLLAQGFNRQQIKSAMAVSRNRQHAPSAVEPARLARYLSTLIAASEVAAAARNYEELERKSQGNRNEQ